MVTIGGDGTLLRGAQIAHSRWHPHPGRQHRPAPASWTDGRGRRRRIRRARPGSSAATCGRERGRADAQVAGSSKLHLAINDVVVRRGAQARMAAVGLVLDGEEIAHMPSDGVIVATPTGSTGYFLSAGGPIIHPAVDALGVAALLPHTLFARPLLVETKRHDRDHVRR